MGKITDMLFGKAINEKVSEIETKMMEVSETLAKAKAEEMFERYKEEESKKKDVGEAEPKSFMYDPFFIMDQMGYKERIMSVSYETLRLMTERNAIVAAVINTRIGQVASFAKKPETKYDMGFEIQTRDRDFHPTNKDKLRIKELEQMFLSTGFPQVVDEESRDTLEGFFSKYIRDSLTYDQACFEVVFGKGKIPVAFYAIDSSSIRRASTPRLLQQMKQAEAMSNLNFSWDHMNQGWMNPNQKAGSQIPSANYIKHPEAFNTALRGINQNSFNEMKKLDIIKYVQILQGRVINTYTEQEMAFGIRNPRTGLYYNGYGVGELETLISTVTAHLWAEEYNKRFFSQGSAPKGMIHFEGGNITQEQITAFRRQWHAQVAGVWNAWKTPIISSPGKMAYQNLQLNNKQMEFTNWIEYLIKLICAVYLIDPSEINFDLRGATGGGQQNAPMFMSGNEAKQKLSKDKGLKPLLSFVETEFNKNVLWQIDDRYSFKFVGLDAKSEKEIMDLRVQEVKTFKQVDEIRAEYDLPPLGPELGGDLIMDSSYIGWRNQKAMAEQQAQMGMDGMGGMPGDEGMEQGEEGPDFGMDFGKEEKEGLDFGEEEKSENQKEKGGKPEKQKEIKGKTGGK